MASIIGRQFEDKVSFLLESLGFKALRTEAFVGRSGQRHRPDLTFEVNGRRFIVECKISFSRENVLSVYGKLTDLAVDHAFLVSQNMPTDLLSYSKRFNLTPILLENNPTSEKKFKNIIETTVNRVIAEKGILKERIPEWESTSYYILPVQELDELDPQFRISKAKLSKSAFLDSVRRVDIDGPTYRANSFIRKLIKQKSAKKVNFPKNKNVLNFLKEIEFRNQATLVRFGIVTDLAYIVTNFRFSGQVGSEYVSKTLAEKRSNLTSLSLRLSSKGFIYVRQTPSLYVRYCGKNQEIFSKMREIFEQLCLGDE